MYRGSNIEGDVDIRSRYKRECFWIEVFGGLKRVSLGKWGR